MSKNNRFISKGFYLLSLVSIVFASFLFFIGINNANAHKVYLFAWAEGDMIHTESYSGDKKVKDGVIKVYTISGMQLLEGKTNVNGEFIFKIPQNTDLKIVLDAGMGHKAEYVFKIDDMMKKSEDEATEDPKVGKDPHTTPLIGMSKEDIKQIIEEALDDRLNPISKRLARMENNNKPGLTEIISGIGYIMGIMGLLLYLKTRAKSRP